MDEGGKRNLQHGCEQPADCRAKGAGLCRSCNMRATVTALHADPDFAKAHAERAAERMRRLNADPDFAKAHAERAAERMRRLHADPDFAKAHAERAAERMRRLHADPEFAKANAERMRRLHADPEFAKANAERMSERHAARKAGGLLPLRLAATFARYGLRPEEADDYRTFRKAGFSAAEAAAAVIATRRPAEAA